MKVLVITDMEGVAGVLNFPGFVGCDGPYYEVGRELATLETSAAVQGLIDAGTTEIHVLDGHGSGAMVPMLLHPAAKLIAGRPITYPFGLDMTFDAVVMVGQHAKAGTEDGHLCHTMDLEQIDCTINGISMGEAGFNMAMAGWLGVPCILVAGDQACCEEARALVPEIETATVKRGINRGAAVHCHPDRARGLIRDAAWRAVSRITEIPPYRMEPPFRLVSTRPDPKGAKGPKQRVVEGDDLIDLLRRTWTPDLALGLTGPG